MTVNLKSLRYFVSGCALASSLLAGLAHADDVDDARKTFTAAYADERAGHFAEALEKFRIVQRVKDTTSVRYRIAACLDALHKLQNARDGYLAVEEVAKPEDAAIVESSKKRARELEAQLGELALRVEGADPEKRVSVDGMEKPLKDGALVVFLDPGEHRISYEPRGEPAVVTPITVDAGRRTVLVLNRSGSQANGSAAVVPPPPPVPRPPEQPPAEGSSTKTLGIVGIVTGTALLVGSAVAFAVRESAISDIESTCPANRCPKSSESDIVSDRSRAKAMLPVAAITGGLGLVALGGGVYFLIRPTAAPGKATAAHSLEGIELGLGGRF